MRQTIMTNELSTLRTTHETTLRELEKMRPVKEQLLGDTLRNNRTLHGLHNSIIDLQRPLAAKEIK